MEEQLQTQDKKERREQRRAEKEAERTSHQRKKTLKKVVTRGVLIGALLAVVVGFYQLSQRDYSGDVAAALAITEADWKKGNPEAEVTLVEYLDFQCPACRAYHPLVKQLVDEYGDRVQFVARHFPIINIHPNAMASGRAAEAAGRQGKFWEMHDKLFELQEEWASVRNPEEHFVRYAEELGLDKERFENDYDDGALADKIEDSRLTAASIGVTGTPTFFLNGQRMQNPGSYEQFKQLIEEALAAPEPTPTPTPSPAN